MVISPTVFLLFRIVLDILIFVFMSFEIIFQFLWNWNIISFIGLCWICSFQKNVHLQIISHANTWTWEVFPSSGIILLEINIIQAFFVHLQSYYTGTQYFVLLIYTDKREDKKNQCFSYVFLEVTMLIWNSPFFNDSVFSNVSNPDQLHFLYFTLPMFIYISLCFAILINVKLL